MNKNIIGSILFENTYTKLLIYLDYPDIINLMIVSGNYNYYKFFYRIIIESKRLEYIKNILFILDYHKFVKGIKFLSKNSLDKLLLSVFNKLYIPAIWKTPCCGYYDIRYLFELIYLGGRINKCKINSNFKVSIYDLYYLKILNNLSDTRDKTINILIDKYDIFFILNKNFLPHPKDNYNIDGWIKNLT